MFRKILMIICAALLITGCGGDNSADKGAENKKDANKLVIYTSMKESLIGGIVEGFKAQNPGIEVDWQSAGAGKIMAKLEAERQSGHLMADIIWTSEVPDFYQMKNEGILEKYQPAGFNELLNPFDDYDGSFTAAREMIKYMAAMAMTRFGATPEQIRLSAATERTLLFIKMATTR